MATRYSESVFCESKPRIDDGVIHGVKILGENSVNKRHYSKAVREAAKDKYEGAAVNIDHPKKGESVDRSIRDWVGNVENVQVRRDGTYGDLRLRKEHAEFKAIVEAAEYFWKDFGLSHVADCEHREVDGIENVTDIVEVFSVDLVKKPGTTSGLTESRNRDMAKAADKNKTVKQVAESLPQDHPARKIMLEACGHKTVMEMMGGDYDMGSLGIEEPVAAGTVSDQLASEAMAALTETNKALLAVLSKAKPAAPGGAPPTNNPPGNQENPPVANDPNKPAENEADKEKEKFAAMESKMARIESKNLLLESDRDANEVWVEAAANISDETKRKAFVESLPKRTANTRESRGSRPDTSPPATTSEGRKQKTADEIFESRRNRNKELRESRQAATAR
jgi:hypothetical protein